MKGCASPSKPNAHTHKTKIRSLSFYCFPCSLCGVLLCALPALAFCAVKEAALFLQTAVLCCKTKRVYRSCFNLALSENTGFPRSKRLATSRIIKEFCRFIAFYKLFNKYFTLYDLKINTVQIFFLVEKYGFKILKLNSKVTSNFPKIGFIS